MGCALHYILMHGLSGLTKIDLSEILVFANAAASLVVTHKGALKVMPDKEDIEKLHHFTTFENKITHKALFVV